MRIVIDIPEVFYEALKKTDEIVSGQRSGKTLMSVIFDAVAKGVPLDTHDEEIIATTVESIWGKPPYTELLDKIRAEIGKSKTEHEMQIAEKDIKAKLLISDIYCDIVNILDKYKAETE